MQEQQHIAISPEKNLPTEIKEKKQRASSVLLLPGVSVGSTFSYSLKAGYMNHRIGGYAKFKSNFTSKGDFVTGQINSNNYNGEMRIGRLSLLGGALIRTTNFLILYIGVGYGERWVQWENHENQYVEIEDFLNVGAEPEVGLIFTIHKFCIGGGVNCLIGKSTTLEGSLSIGFIF
ncbi:opacity protein-like surface antigen [Parabacteroides sp. PFB2-12]|uniref:hypothetical protein n=1 Tax=unclassified Parabacteroides TaxID=2649774 RepID=UPI0024738171|nr:MULTISPECIES: hypothetical protein [unclassified Parabacteroides]MDH6341579.1 opacity protein-like surface antigen [Parabacteroides sp. PM6-13]MDH6389998.1 opacity protein-like surface antigen [Parabacteroides sp. PFB2-12]